MSGQRRFSSDEEEMDEEDLIINTPQGPVNVGRNSGITVSNNRVYVRRGDQRVEVITRSQESELHARQPTAGSSATASESARSQQSSEPETYRRPSVPLQRPRKKNRLDPQPEFVEINRPKHELKTTDYLSKEENELWKNFFCQTVMCAEAMFVEHNGYVLARRKLWYNGFVTITGHPGEGKTWLAEHLVTKFVQSPEKYEGSSSKKEEKERFRKKSIPEKDRQKYTWAFLKSPDEWKRKTDVDKHQIIVIDDIFGPAALDIKKMKEWIPVLKEISASIRKHRPKQLVVICLHKHQYEKLPFDLTSLDLFHPELIIDLSVRKTGPDDIDRERIMNANTGYYGSAWSYTDHGDVRFNNVYQAFPFVCKLYSMVKSFSMEGQMFFKNPDRSFENAIQKVYSFDKIIYFTLACAVLFDGTIELDKFTFEEFPEKQQRIIRKLIQVLEVPAHVDLGKMRYAASLLRGIFFFPIAKHCWQFTHERSFHLVTENMGRKIGRHIVELCSRDFLVNRIRTSSHFGGTLESVITIWNQDYDCLCQRFTFEVLAGGLDEICTHPTLNEKKFADKWFNFMSEMGSLLPVVQQRGAYNRSLFFWSTYYGHDATVEQFLTHEDLSELREEEWFKDEMKAGLLASCCGDQKGHASVFNLLMKAGVPLDAKDPLPEEDLEDMYGSDVAFLIKLKAPLMHLAALRGTDEIIANLAAQGADPNEKTQEGYTPMHRAACNRKDGALRALIKLKADVNHAAPNGRRPIHLALMRGDRDYVRLLRSEGVDIKSGAMFDESSYICMAAAMGNADLVRDLIDNGAEPRGKVSKDLLSPLHIAISMGDEETMRKLIDKGADFKYKCAGGWTPLHFAVFFYQENIAKYLIEKGAEVDATAYSNKTPLHIAAQQGHIDICIMLLNKGANPDLRTSYGEFPCTLAAMNGHVEVARFLIREGLEDIPGTMDLDSEDMMHLMMAMRHPMFR